MKLNENYEVDGGILNCDYLRYSPAETSTRNTTNSQIYINIPREDRFISLLKKYLELNFAVIENAYNTRYANSNDILLVSLGLIALFINFKLTTSSGKHLEDISHAYMVFLLYKLLTSSRSSDDLAIGFDRDCREGQQESSNNKNMNGKYHLRRKLKEFFSFAEYQEEA